MSAVSFHIRRDGESWVVAQESGGRELGGIFSTLVAALEFVDGEACRFQDARAVIELSPRARTVASRPSHRAAPTRP